MVMPEDEILEHWDQLVAYADRRNEANKPK